MPTKNVAKRPNERAIDIHIANRMPGKMKPFRLRETSRAPRENRLSFWCAHSMASVRFYARSFHHSSPLLRAHFWRLQENQFAGQVDARSEIEAGRSRSNQSHGNANPEPNPVADRQKRGGCRVRLPPVPGKGAPARYRDHAAGFRGANAETQRQGHRGNWDAGF